MDRICPSCGAGSSRKEFVGEFCSECYAKRNEPSWLPKKIVIAYCKRCGRIKFAGWSEPSAEVMEKIARQQLVGHKRDVDVKNSGDVIEVAIIRSVEGKEARLAKKIPVERTESLCDACYRKASGYFEAVVQLRGERRNVEALARKIGKIVSRNSFVSKTEESAQGVDIYVGSRASAADALGELHLAFTQSMKIAGVRDGRRIYRATYCVRV